MKTIMKQTNRHLNKVSSVGYITKIMFPHWVRLLIWSLGLDKAPFMQFMSRVLVLWTCNGSQFLVNYTKECTLLMHKYISGQPQKASSHLIVGLKAGLPSIIPGILRLKIKDGDSVVIRGVLTLFAVYRVIQVPGILKLSTITDKFSGLSDTLPKYEISLAMSELKGYGWPSRLKPIELKLISTAGPNHSVSMLGIWKDILAWKVHPLFPRLREYLLWAPGGSGILSILDREIEFLEGVEPSNLYLARLSEKEEAAGKVRIFAIVDAITQSVFAPLSEYVFRILKNLPMDGTFDQGKPIHLLSGKLGMGECFYSYDLSAATDRLPLQIQKDVLSHLFGFRMAYLWGEILVGRDYILRQRGKDNLSLRYSVGQPMGALSSWAMLALTHHIIVRVAANRVGKSNFQDYALLGDDIVIGNEAVATSYYSIMTTILGVEINLSKSMQSTDSLEFAKRIVTSKGELTPVGPKNLLVCIKSAKGIPSVFLDLINKGLSLSVETLDQLFEKSPFLRTERERSKWLWMIKGPFGFVPTAYGFSPFETANNSLYAGNHHSLPGLLLAMWNVNLRQCHSTWEGNVSRSWDVILKLEGLARLDGLDKDLTDSPLRQYILSVYYEEFSKLLAEEPRPSEFPRFETFEELMNPLKIFEKISSIIKDDSLVTFSVLDPWKSDEVVLPLSRSKVHNYWAEVLKVVRQGGYFGAGALTGQIVKDRYSQPLESTATSFKSGPYSSSLPRKRGRLVTIRVRN